MSSRGRAVAKQVEEDKTPAPPLLQENVFIESSRPKYVEDLHNEAQEGLKLLQQEGSTFRPLNSGKKPEKVKSRRRHRRTVMGIPQHVQRELGLDRMDLKGNPVLDEELDEIMNSEAASDNVDRPALALLHLGSEMSQRPRSLAVPWMTTANSGQHGPPSPVMSMNPQAAYMSKIIPNAVMPPSIEVLEIKRGRSRNSLKTVSKSSLLLASPSGSRASSRASSCRGPSSASQYRGHYQSDSSGWSRSGSSETLVSDSSTISSSTTHQQKSSADERNPTRNSSPMVDKHTTYPFHPQWRHQVQTLRALPQSPQLDLLYLHQWNRSGPHPHHQWIKPLRPSSSDKT
ncbi:hypothetical protein CRUP_019770 [Coryphaenoides rupestris]|nr:hypothetical protein CRUP_019770 [Coryphaenoides rupestris]